MLTRAILNDFVDASCKWRVIISAVVNYELFIKLCKVVILHHNICDIFPCSFCKSHVIKHVTNPSTQERSGKCIRKRSFLKLCRKAYKLFQVFFMRYMTKKNYLSAGLNLWSFSLELRWTIKAVMSSNTSPTFFSSFIILLYFQNLWDIVKDVCYFCNFEIIWERWLKKRSLFTQIRNNALRSVAVCHLADFLTNWRLTK